MIRTGDHELILSVIRSFTQQNEMLLDQLMSIIYYFRGAITRDESWQLSFLEREKHIEFLNKRFEDASGMMKNRIPVFL